MSPTLHMPIQDTIRAELEALLKPLGEIIKPLARILFVEAEDQTVPIRNLDTFFTLLYTELLLFDRNGCIGVV